MKRHVVTLLVASIAFVGFAVPASAQTQAPEVQVTVVGHAGIVTGSSSDHFLGFSGPVEIPGFALAPGDYIFRIIAPSVMQVLSNDRSVVYAMLLVTPTSRSEATHDYAVALERIGAEAPPRITKLFLPKELTGYELRYPKIESAGGVQ